MILHKEEIFCDFGDAWQKLTDLEKGTQSEGHMGYSIKDVLDAQFYTHRSKQWYKKTLGYFQAKYDRKEIENAPIVVDKTGDPQVKVEGQNNRKKSCDN